MRNPARREPEKGRASGMETGTLFSLAAVLAVFELFPSFEYGRLARQSTDDQMQGYDADVIYEVPPLPDEDPDIDVQDLIDGDDFDMDPVTQILNLRGDTLGLDHAGTIVPDLPDGVDPDQNTEPPEPGTWIPHSQPPTCTFRPVPEYPDLARQAGVEGSVSLQLFIDPDGSVERVVVTGSSGLGSLDSAAVASARQSSWVPAQRDDGAPVGVWTAMIYRFVLED